MNSLDQSYKYIIELTEAYKNGFITKDECKAVAADEMVLIALRLVELKGDIFIKYSSMFIATIWRANNILSMSKAPKNINFKSGCVNVGEAGREVILANDGKLFCPGNHDLIPLPKNIKL